MQEQPGPPTDYPRSYQPVNGILILVLGILGLTTCYCLTGLPAWLLGNSAMAAIRSGVGDPKEEQMVNIGRILGIISTCLSFCIGVFYVVMFAIGFGSSALQGAGP